MSVSLDNTIIMFYNLENFNLKKLKKALSFLELVMKVKGNVISGKFDPHAVPAPSNFIVKSPVAKMYIFVDSQEKRTKDESDYIDAKLVLNTFVRGDKAYFLGETMGELIERLISNDKINFIPNWVYFMLTHEDNRTTEIFFSVEDQSWFQSRIDAHKSHMSEMEKELKKVNQMFRDRWGHEIRLV